MFHLDSTCATYLRLRAVHQSYWGSDYVLPATRHMRRNLFWARLKAADDLSLHVYSCTRCRLPRINEPGNREIEDSVMPPTIAVFEGQRNVTEKVHTPSVAIRI
jgi:hypothetical protein